MFVSYEEAKKLLKDTNLIIGRADNNSGIILGIVKEK